MNQCDFSFAFTFANSVISHIVDIKSSKNQQVNIGHRKLSDDFVKSDLANNMTINIQKRLKEKGIETEISFSKVDNNNHHQIEIKII